MEIKIDWNSYTFSLETEDGTEVEGYFVRRDIGRSQQIFVEFDSNDLPENWEEIEEEVKSEILARYE